MSTFIPGIPIGAILLGIGGMVLYIIWLWIFLRVVRPFFAKRLGRSIGHPIQEKGRGQWEVDGSTGAGVVTSTADIIILLVGALGPLIIVSCFFLILFGP